MKRISFLPGRLVILLQSAAGQLPKKAQQVLQGRDAGSGSGRRLGGIRAKNSETKRVEVSVIYALDAREIVTTMGAYIHEEKFYLHATGFVLRPDKTIELAGYSSGTISRMTADDALTLSKYLRRSS
jgi:hypothetical protein